MSNSTECFWINKDTIKPTEYLSVGRERLIPLEDRSPTKLHRCLPGYKATPLVSLPQLAKPLGIRQLLVKDESSRFGLPAFKVLGASWATVRALEEHLGTELVKNVHTLGELKSRLYSALDASRKLTLTAATDGNHGRAVAYMARLLELDAVIFVPQGTSPARINSITAEGARVVEVEGSYDDAVKQAEATADEYTLVIADTATNSSERTPRWVVEGYSTIFTEIDDQLSKMGLADPDVMAVQMGVGALAAAAIRHYKGFAVGSGNSEPPIGELRRRHTRLLGVEPDTAACVLTSLQKGQLTNVPGPHESIMAGLNCGNPSPVAWPSLVKGLDASISIDDAAAIQAVRDLYQAGLISGETGAAGLAGIEQALRKDEYGVVARALPINHAVSVLVISTEGATDPSSFAEIVKDLPPLLGS